MNVICAHCDRRTNRDEACEHCGEEPVLRGRYQLEEVVGNGASGTTYRAQDVHEGRTVAIKEMGIHGIETLKAHELFEREADVLCRLEHPGIPEFFDYFEWGEAKALRFYLVMEFVEGKTLREALDESYVGAQQARDVIWQLAEIARYLHKLEPPVIHRDIKPSNVLRRPDGDLVLIDFGSVRDVLEPEDSGSTIAGTIGYMAPEQLRGTAMPASDVYGIGATALHLLARREPVEFLGANHGLDWDDQIDVPRWLRRLMRRMLAHDSEDRISDGDALIKALAGLSTDNEEPSREQGGEDHLPAPRRTKPGRPSVAPRAPAAPPMRKNDSSTAKGLLSMVLKFGVGSLALVGFLTLSTCAACAGWLYLTDLPTGQDPAGTSGGEPFSAAADGTPKVHELRAPRASAEPEVVLDATAEREIEVQLLRHTPDFIACAQQQPVETTAVTASFGIDHGEPVDAQITNGDPLPEDVETCLVERFDELEFDERRNMASVKVSIPLE